MKILNHYIEQQNRWRAIFGDEAWQLPKHALIVHGHLENDLSPENLTCDGELTAAQARTKREYLEQALRELEQHYPEYVRVL